MMCFPSRKHRKHAQRVAGKALGLPHGMWRIQIVAALLCLVAVSATLTFAWFHNQKSIQTVTMIHEPNALVIGAGDARSIRELELSNIDVSADQKNKDVIFCVYSENNFPYNLQLAHTTNIGFNYTIYPATQGAIEGKTILNYLEKKYSFDERTTLEGGYLNRQEGTKVASASGIYHDKTYARSDDLVNVYDNVQINAEPLYWKNSQPLQFPARADEGLGVYINYYVLRISWDENVVNNKETDMVYLMAEAASSGE